jgi:hypothetical protein
MVKQNCCEACLRLLSSDQLYSWPCGHTLCGACLEMAHDDPDFDCPRCVALLEEG